MIKKIKITFLIIFIFSFFTNLALPALAEESWFGGPLINANCTGKSTNINNCGVTQAFETLINVSKIILALTGSAALLMFTYGGVMWIISAGSQEKVEKGKTILTTATLGIIVILGSWLIVNFVIFVLIGYDDYSKLNGVKIFNNYWFQEQPVGNAPGDPMIEQGSQFGAS